MQSKQEAATAQRAVGTKGRRFGHWNLGVWRNAPCRVEAQSLRTRHCSNSIGGLRTWKRDSSCRTQNSEEGVEGWQNMPLQNMSHCLKDSFERKAFEKTAIAKGHSNPPFASWNQEIKTSMWKMPLLYQNERNVLWQGVKAKRILYKQALLK